MNDLELKEKLEQAIRRHIGMKLYEQVADVMLDEILSLLPPTPSCEVEPQMDNQLREQVTKILGDWFGNKTCSDIAGEITELLPPTPSCLGEEGIEKILDSAEMSIDVNKLNGMNMGELVEIIKKDFVKALTALIIKWLEGNIDKTTRCECIGNCDRKLKTKVKNQLITELIGELK